MLRLRETEGQALNCFAIIQAPRSETPAFIPLGLPYLNVALGLPPDFSATGDVPNGSGILFGRLPKRQKKSQSESAIELFGKRCKVTFLHRVPERFTLWS
jgi:hypothetical protein